MIREKSLFCKLIRIKNSTKILFDAYMAAFHPEQATCPTCGSHGNCRIHAYYSRKIIDFVQGRPVRSKLTVLRLVCGSCGHTHAVLPDAIIPYSSYGLFFILRVLGEAFGGYRTREQLCERFGVTLNQFYKWMGVWKQHKEEWLGVLGSMETPCRAFLLEIACRTDYSVFRHAFTQKTAFSFLQTHRNPAVKRIAGGGFSKVLFP